MHPFPHQYNVKLKWNEGRLGQVDSNDNQSMLVGPPPEFEGPDNVWSPEDQLLSSIASCLMTTFFALSERKKIEVSSYETDISGKLEKTKNGILFTEIDMTVHLATNNNETARVVLEQAEKYCIISNMLTIDPKLNIEFTS